jgi:hypothetical protein
MESLEEYVSSWVLIVIILIILGAAFLAGAIFGG